MPKVKNKKGEVVADFAYTNEGQKAAENLASQNPDLNIDFAPGGQMDGSARRQTMYAGGGQTGFNQIGAQPLYKKGGKVKKKSKVKDKRVTDYERRFLTEGEKKLDFYERLGKATKAKSKAYKEGGKVKESPSERYERRKKEIKRNYDATQYFKSGYANLSKSEKRKVARSKKKQEIIEASRKHYGLDSIKERMKAKRAIRKKKRERIKAIKRGKETNEQKLTLAKHKLSKEK